MLYHSDLVMYDRQTESLWSQIEGRAIAGALAGTELDRIPVQTVTWAQWQAAHPDGWVLSRETGVDRDYGANPYVGYDSPDSYPFLFRGEPDPRLPPKERVAGLGGDEDPVAVPLSDLVEAGVAEVVVGGRPVVLWATEGLRSPLDKAHVGRGRAVGATGAFDPVLDGEHLEFTRSEDGFFADTATGSRWNVLGKAVEGPLAGARLTPAEHLDTFWFAWAAFHPTTRLAGID